MPRWIVVPFALALAAGTGGCVAYGHPDAHRYGSRYDYARSYSAWPARTVVVERRPVYVHRHVHGRYEPRREWLREHRHHGHHRHDRDRDGRHRRDGHRRR